jgi:IS30 family transposase
MTLCHRRSGFLLIFKIERATVECTTGILDYLEAVCEGNDIAFDEVFGCLLTDNGSEFSDAEAIERSSIDPKMLRCSLYYCDPYSSWQKPHVENIHTLIRRVLPKGVSLEMLNHAQVNRICSHVNSYPRISTDQTPYEQMRDILGVEVLFDLGIRKIYPVEVRLNPSLLDTRN